MCLGGRTTGMKETPIPYWWLKKRTILKSNLAEDRYTLHVHFSTI